jgi:SAM-dependent methyltransferase
MAPLRAALERVRDRSRVLLTLNYGAGQLLYRMGVRRHLSGATHLAHNQEEGADYVEAVFRDYMTIGRLEPSHLAGQRILEVGPGDNLGVALMFAAHGALVTCLDRFDPARDDAKNRQIYRAVAERLPPGPRAAARQLLASDDSLKPGSISVVDDLAIEDAHRRFEPGTFGLIVSRAVLEHVFDVDRAWTSMHVLLQPGGTMLHKIDFRNHGFYASLDPLAFLGIPEGLWRLISSPDPTLNRRRASTYQAMAERDGYRYSIFATHLLHQEEELPLGSIRWPLDPERMSTIPRLDALSARLKPKFTDASPEDLAVEGIFILARKPAVSA